MSIQFLSDSNGKMTAVQVPIEEWERIKKRYPDIEHLSSDLPEWQKELLDKRIASINQNPERLHSIDDLFNNL
jgi:hypothetical protein